jgi:hypothetical protein
MNSGEVHPYVLPATEPLVSGLLALMFALLEVIDGGSAGLVVLEVPDELRSHLITRVDAALGESVEALPGVAVH